MGKSLLVLLLLLLMVIPSFATWYGRVDATIDCPNNRLGYFIYINQTGSCGSCGYSAMTDGMVLYLNGTIQDSTIDCFGIRMYPLLGPIVMECVGGYCFANGYVYNTTLFNCSNLLFTFRGMNVSSQNDANYYPYDCNSLGYLNRTGFSRLEYMSLQYLVNSSGTKFFNFGTFSLGIDSGQCYDQRSAIDPLVNRCYFSGAYFPYYAKQSCPVTCTFNPDLPICDIPGHVGDGVSFYCNVYGEYSKLHECIEGGWQDCGLPSVESCPGVVSELRVANLQRELDRVSITDSVGRTLQWTSVQGLGDDGYYMIYAGQRVDRVEFRLVENDSLRDWIANSNDVIRLNYTWNSTQANCTYVPGSTSLNNDESGDGGSYYVDTGTVSCVLNVGYDDANVTLLVEANLTNQGMQQVSDPFVSETFVLRVVKDVVLLDNFQMLYINSTGLAYSGHFVRVSDLVDIPTDSVPGAIINFEIYDRDNPSSRLVSGGSTLAGGFEGGVPYYNDTGFFYLEFASVGGSSVGDIVQYNATISATGYADSSYGTDETYLSPIRVLYFKCRNIPRNVTFDSVNLMTSPVKFECSYKLANESEISVLDLQTQTDVKLVSNTNSEFTQAPNLHWVLIQVLFNIANLQYNHNTSFQNPVLIDVPFEKSVGGVLYNSLDGATYEKLSAVLGVPLEMPAGRYLGRWGVLDNPTFYIVKTYVDFIIEPDVYSSFSLSDVSFDKSVYAEGDNVSCIANWYDPQDIIRGWQVQLSGMAGHTYTLTSDDLDSGYCDPESDSECWAKSVECFGTIGDSSRFCRGIWSIYGIQKCLAYAGDSNTSMCTQAKWPFIDGKKSGDITCTVILMKASGIGGAESDFAVATLNLRSTDLFGMIKDTVWGFLTALFGDVIGGLLNFDLGTYVMLALMVLLMPIIIVVIMWRPAQGTGDSVARLLETRERIRGIRREPELDMMEKKAFDVQQQLRIAELSRRLEDMTQKERNRFAGLKGSAKRKLKR